MENNGLQHTIRPVMAVANEFLELGNAENVGLDVMKLEKLCYYAHGFFLGNYGLPLFSETIVAEKFGPVIPVVHVFFQNFGTHPITLMGQEVDENGKRFVPTLPTDATKERSLINQVWKELGAFSGRQLSTLTHEDGSPWDIVWNSTSGDDDLRRPVTIPDSIIQRVFTEKVRQNRERAAAEQIQ